jgi:hypothetical protein
MLYNNTLMTRNIVGAVVRGDDFFGRESFVSRVWEVLNTSNVLLAGPRRFGKTSVMYNILDFPKPGSRVVHVDLEPVKEPAEFIVVFWTR